LAIEPKVLLLDEPFGALDAKVRQKLREWLRRLHEQMHTTTILVTHDQEEALEVADRIATSLVEGTVLSQDGKALERATVVFHPTDAQAKFPKPRGTTDAQGRFQLSTYDTADGAPVGKYKVTIEQWYRDTPDQAPTNHLPPALASEATSGLEVQLSKGTNVLEPFKIR
jgi:ABC-type sulfate/molybdate transport systems ATPase subunit